MPSRSLPTKLRHIWNWIRGKRIIPTDPERGRVMIRTGHNSANRDDGAQWYLQRFDSADGPPPLPRCSRGRLEHPTATLGIERWSGAELIRARNWYEMRHGALSDGQELELVCVFDRNDRSPGSRVLNYRPNEVFEIEHPWLGAQYAGPSFRSYFGTWYGSGMLREEDIMDFETFWEVHPRTRPLPRWGASWR